MLTSSEIYIKYIKYYYILNIIKEIIVNQIGYFIYISYANN